MVQITIIGWYGTETIGDRAILSGIVSLISEAYQDVCVWLGSLYPVVSEHTLIDDADFLNRCTQYRNGKMKLELFYSGNAKELRTAISKSDLLLVGGGPLMDIMQMHMLDYALSYAKRKNIKTAICGCGWGPLKSPEFISVASDIIVKSDIVLLRDPLSVEMCKKMVGKEKKIEALVDPSFFALQFFMNERKKVDRESSSLISINYREIISDIQGTYSSTLEKDLIVLTQKIAENFKNNMVLLVPMHTFAIGGDDRILLNRIAGKVKMDNVLVQNVPLSLEDTMDKYFSSSFCIGMRYHAVLFQTVLNGCNFILDYTDENNGKTIGLLRQLNAEKNYTHRYVSLRKKETIDFDIRAELHRFFIDEHFINTMRSKYISYFSNLYK